MQGFRITKQSLKNHFHYGVWMYIAIIAVVAIMSELLLSTTAYRPPDEHKVDIVMIGLFAGAEPLQPLADAIMADAPDIDPVLEAVSVTGIVYSGDPNADMYGAMNFQVKLAAQVGDAYIVSGTIAQQLINLEAYYPLDDLISGGLLDEARALKLQPDPAALLDEADEPGEQQMAEPEPIEPVDVVNALSIADLTRLSEPDVAFDTIDACLIIAPGCKNPELTAKVVARFIDALKA